MRTQAITHGTCAECEATVRIRKDGTPYRHKGSTAFDVATDGICSGSESLCKEEMYATDEEMYYSIADELTEPTMTLDDIDPAALRAGQHYARREALPWPPVPQASGWQMTIISY